ncbi:MAG: phosphoribosyltransferase family protein [Thermodesulfobacteriota bacterium]
MEEYQKEFARCLAETGALFFAPGLRLKDGRPTPYFVNLGLFRTGRLCARIGSFFADMLVSRGLIDQVDVLVGPSYKGSALAVATALALWSEHGIDLAFDYDRKEAKSHGEATGRPSLFVTNALVPGSRVFIIDDVGTTMGTKYELIKLLEAESQARSLDLALVGVGLAVDREQTSAVVDENGQVALGVKGEDALGLFRQKTGLPVISLVGIREAVHYLAEEVVPVMINGLQRPLDQATLKEFDQYLATYGVDR